MDVGVPIDSVSDGKFPEAPKDALPTSKKAQKKEDNDLAELEAWANS